MTKHRGCDQMNAQEEACPHTSCPDDGKKGQGNIVIHSQQEKRYQCQTCRRTFSQTWGTAK